MKKINVITQNNEKNFIKTFLEEEKIDFEIFNEVEYINSNKFSDEIKKNDRELLKAGNFEAQILQSVNDNIPTRLLIPNSFSDKENYQKVYDIYHELGHYYSIEKDLVCKYYSFLENNTVLKGELFKLPFEIEAEKYVFKKHKEFFEKNADEVYLIYLSQIDNKIDLINEEMIKNPSNFYGIYEIRLFRYNCIIENICDNQSEFYKKHKNNINKIKKRLESKGKLFSEINKEVDLLNNSIKEDFYKNNDFEKYSSECKLIYGR